MANGVIYLDSDDEITSAAARIRGVDGRRVALVLPYGSRVATSRINFRLLARDALVHEKRLSIVAGDAAARALAASAGIPVFATVGEYEDALGTEGAIADRPLEASVTVVPPSPSGASAGRRQSDGETAAATESGDVSGARTSAVTRGVAASVAGGATASGVGGRGGTARPGVPSDAGAGRAIAAQAPTGARRAGGGGIGRVGRTAVLIGLAVLAMAILVGGVAAYLLLPSASAVVTPREETIGPVSMRISASTMATAPDTERGIVPAKVVPIDVEASDTFQATGKRVEEARAKGSVQFQNFDFTSSNTIPRGSIVRTGDGVAFRTAAAVTVPAADLVGVTVFPTAKDVAITAVDAGPEGNVPANAITVVPRGESDISLRVTNPRPTTGGDRKEFPRVTQNDVDTAMAGLRDRLQTAFTDRLDDPDLVSGDATVFPETAKLGEPTPSVALDSLVGKEVASFDLGATASGTVTTVDAGPVRAIAEARLDASVEPGHQLVAGSSEISESPAVVEGDTITYPVVATARQIAILDPVAIKSQIMGRPLDEARAILDRYGEAALTVWPDWVGTIPTIDSRVEVQVDGPTIEDAGRSPGPSAGPDPSASPSGSSGGGPVATP